jgi:hypothetical protein
MATVKLHGFLALALVLLVLIAFGAFFLSVTLLLIPLVLVLALVSWLLRLLQKRKRGPVVRVYYKKF